ncbi:hypothetical protein CTAYLR_004821 [Chrysophaeum taylorii]|uniref:Uncharacterized protein n=1 Tax=Chrysophaeum taylorii TaxID=2483200 RepID=A0AAD7UPD6_9STRA|nr:hypothetical protein CTAYLR_004821 [Chrysophaeum taylorii]
MSMLWAQYNRALAAQPLIVKALTSFTGFTAGDLLAQKAVERKDEIDFMRTARMATFGLLWHGPSGHYFYGFLDSKLPGTTMTTVFTKVGIDQVLWNPIFGTVFFTYLGLTEGKSSDQIVSKIKADLPTAVTGSWAYWIPASAHFVNFRFIPGEQRLLYINCMQIMYNIFLSFLGNKEVKKQ